MNIEEFIEYIQDKYDVDSVLNIINKDYEWLYKKIIKELLKPLQINLIFQWKKSSSIYKKLEIHPLPLFHLHSTGPFRPVKSSEVKPSFSPHSVQV